jgi:hypothetical protein
MPGIPLVLATMNTGKSYVLEIARFKCNDTGKELISSSILYPYSPYSGSSLTKVGSKVITITSKELKSGAHKVCTCADCGFDVYINKSAAKQKELKSKFYCPVCAADLHDLSKINTTDEMTMVPQSEEEAASGGNNLNPSNVMSDDNDDDDALPGVSTMNGPDEDNVIDSNPMRKSAEFMSSKKSKKNKNKSAKVDEVNPPGGKIKLKAKPEETTVPDNENSVEIGKEAANDSSAGSDGLKVAAQVNLLANIKSLSSAAIDMVPVSENVIYIFANQTPVITLDKKLAATDVQPLFDNVEALFKAFTASVAEKDFDLASFGGKPIVVAVKIDRLIKDKIKSAKRKYKKDLAKIEASLEDNYFDALCLSAVAVTKNVVSDKPNTVKLALISALKDAGVRSPEKLVDSAFSSEGENLMRNIMAYAKEYINKTTSAKREITKFIAKAAYTETASSVEEDTDTDISNHLFRASAGFTVPATSMALTAGSDNVKVVSSDVDYYSNLLRK